MFKQIRARVAAILGVAALVFSISPLFAEESASALKIGVVDTNVLLERYVLYRDVYSQLNEEFLSKDKYLLRKRDELEQLRRELLNSSEEESDLRQLERTIVNLERDFVRLSNDVRQEFNLRKNEELYKIQKDINDGILKYATVHDYDMILESGLIYAKEKHYLTDAIFEMLTEEE